MPVLPLHPEQGQKHDVRFCRHWGPRRHESVKKALRGSTALSETSNNWSLACDMSRAVGTSRKKKSIFTTVVVKGSSDGQWW